MLSRAKKNRKGISVMVEYVLLIAIAISISTIVYAWLRTYVPTADTTKCPDGVSIYIDKITYDCLNSLNITVKNNGRFTIAGYFIRATNSSEQDLAAIDLSPYLNKSFGGLSLNSWVKFHQTGENTLPPSSTSTMTYQLPSGKFGKLYSVELMVAMYQTQNDKSLFYTCTNSRIKQNLVC